MKRRFGAALTATVLLVPSVNSAKALPLISYFEIDHTNTSPNTWDISGPTLIGRNLDAGTFGSNKDGGFGANRSSNGDLSGLFSTVPPTHFRSITGNDYTVSFDVPSSAKERSSSDSWKSSSAYLTGIIAASPIPFGTHAPSKPDMGWLTHIYTTLAFVAGQTAKWPHLYIQVNPPCAPGGSGGGGPVSTVPLPPALPLLATGLAALGIFARRRKSE